MNVLLTCAGRRNYLIQFFREALDPPGKIFAADACADAPALAEADEAFLLPVLGDPTYIDQLLAICQERRVGLLISLNDLELLLLAQHRDRFLAIGVSPVISSPMVVNTCFDKWESFLFLKANGIATPRTYLSPATARAALARGDIAFPLVVKPRWGSGSAGIEYVEDADELDLVYALAAKRFESAQMAKPPAERLAEPLEREIPHRHGAVRLAGAHDEFAPDEGGHVPTLEIIVCAGQYVQRAGDESPLWRRLPLLARGGGQCACRHDRLGDRPIGGSRLLCRHAARDRIEMRPCRRHGYAACRRRRAMARPAARGDRHHRPESTPEQVTTSESQSPGG